MVVFTCNACSAVLKRNQVDKHCYQCRRCESLSCVDCGKDFWGDDYLQHIKCMTEEEKYCGKDNVPKVFKGEAKQEQWVEQVQAAIEKASSNPKLKNVLERLKEYSNIPRKKAKFENFVRNSLRVNNPSLVTGVWEILMANKKNQSDQSNENSTTEVQKKSDSVKNIAANLETSDSQPNEDTIESSAPKNKRERKEERRKKGQKKEKKDKEESEELPLKTKKRKRNEPDDEENPGMENGGADHEEGLEKKKNKKKRGEALHEIENETDDKEENVCEVDEEEEEDVPPPKKQKKMKFNWELVIKSVLEQKGEMTLKKLRKKVLNEFAAQDSANYNEDNLSAKFDKKVSKIAGVKVHKDRACLKTKR